MKKNGNENHLYVWYCGVILFVRERDKRIMLEESGHSKSK